MDIELVDLRLAVSTEMKNNNDPINVKCPDSVHSRSGRKDANASLSVYQHNLHCHGCGFHLTRRKKWAALALVLGLWDGISDDYSPAMLARERGSEFVRSPEGFVSKVETRPAAPLSLGHVKGMNNYLLKHRQDKVEREFVSKRGISSDQLKEALIGHDGTRYSIPVFDTEGQLVTVRYRRDDDYGTKRPDDDREYPKYEGTYGRNKPCLYPEDRLVAFVKGQQSNGVSKQDRLDIYIVEGELDALLLWQCGVAAITITNGAGQCHLTPELVCNRVGIAGTSIRFVIATDQDGAGNKAAGEIAIAAERLGSTWTRAEWPSQLKDMCAVGGYCQHTGIDNPLDLVIVETE